jgi:hypothetical protein
MNRCATVVAAVALGALGACSVPLENPGVPRPSPDAVAACNSRADEEFTQQNRGASYQSDTYQTSQRDSPYSGAGLPETAHGLSDQYERAQDVKHCLNGVATPLAPAPAATPAP